MSSKGDKEQSAAEQVLEVAVVRRYVALHASQ